MENNEPFYTNNEPKNEEFKSVVGNANIQFTAPLIYNILAAAVLLISFICGIIFAVTEVNSLSSSLIVEKRTFFDFAVAFDFWIDGFIGAALLSGIGLILKTLKKCDK